MKYLAQFKGLQQIAVLIDPEKCQDKNALLSLVEKIHFSGVHFVFIGGSTVSEHEFEFTIQLLKEHLSIPIIIFPGASHHVSPKADGILLLNLISGRNPDYLISHHVAAAETIVKSSLEVISTSYILIDGGSPTTVAYISQTTPIPSHSTSIIYNTALAGKLIGHKAIYLDAGSGAANSIPPAIIERVKSLGSPLIVGGGIRTVEQINQYHQSGANIVVIGTKIEEDIDFLLDIRSYINEKK